MQYSIMSSQFEVQKNRKAFTYTLIICGALLLLLIFINIPHPVFTVPVPRDLIEINLGNDMEGWGEEQPLVKGEMSPEPPQPDEAQAAPTTTANEPVADRTDDDETDEAAAPLPKPERTTRNPVVRPEASVTPVPSRTTPPNPSSTPAPKPQRPRFTYNGPGNGNGNGATEDNGYRNQGNNPGGRGDAGSPSGNPDSYGNTPGGRTGGPRVIGGSRKIIKYYAFSGDLDKATVYALVRVSPAGVGTFAGFGKNSTTRAQAYANAISEYLRNVQFDKANAEELVTVQFNFTVR
jgi:hypothetical protein